MTNNRYLFLSDFLDVVHSFDVPVNYNIYISPHYVKQHCRSYVNTLSFDGLILRYRWVKTEMESVRDSSTLVCIA